MGAERLEHNKQIRLWLVSRNLEKRRGLQGIHIDVQGMPACSLLNFLVPNPLQCNVLSATAAALLEEVVRAFERTKVFVSNVLAQDAVKAATAR